VISQRSGGGGSGLVLAALGTAQERQGAQLLAAGARVRRDGKVVQETVAQLGELDAAGRANARLLAQQITGVPPNVSCSKQPPAMRRRWRCASIA